MLIAAVACRSPFHPSRQVRQPKATPTPDRLPGDSRATPTGCHRAQDNRDRPPGAIRRSGAFQPTTPKRLFAPTPRARRMRRAGKWLSRPTRVALESLCRDQFRPPRCGLLWHEQRTAWRTCSGGLIVSSDFPATGRHTKAETVVQGEPCPARRARRVNRLRQPLSRPAQPARSVTYKTRLRSDSLPPVGKVEDGHAALFTACRTRVAQESLWRDQFRPLDGDCYGMNRPTSARSDVGQPVANGPLLAPARIGRLQPLSRARTSDSAPPGRGSSGGSSDGSRGS